MGTYVIILKYEDNSLNDGVDLDFEYTYVTDKQDVKHIEILCDSIKADLKYYLESNFEESEM